MSGEMDVATLGLEFETKKLLAGQAALKETERTGNKVADALDDAGKRGTKGLNSISDAANTVRAAIATLGIGLLVREVVRVNDEYAQLTGRLRLVTNGTSELTSAQQELFKIAQLTRSEYGSTVELYTRVARGAGDVVKSQQQLLALTKLTNQAFQISGASSQEAASGVMQFGQALQSGTLQGDELRSIRENAPRLFQAIVEGAARANPALGVTKANFRDLAGQGKITTDLIVRALLTQSSVIEQEFGKLPQTVGGTITQLRNEFEKAISSADTSGLVNSIDELKATIKAPAVQQGLATLASGLLELTATAVKLAPALEGALKVYLGFVGINFAKSILESAAAFQAQRVAASAAAAALVDATAVQAAATAQTAMAVAGSASITLARFEEAKATALNATANAELAQTGLLAAEADYAKARASSLSAKTSLEAATGTYQQAQAEVVLTEALKKQIAPAAAVLAAEANLARARRLAAATATESISVSNALAAAQAREAETATAAAAAQSALVAAQSGTAIPSAKLLTAANALNVAFAGLIGYQIGSFIYEQVAVKMGDYIDELNGNVTEIQKIESRIKSLGIGRENKSDKAKAKLDAQIADLQKQLGAFDGIEEIGQLEVQIKKAKGELSSLESLASQNLGVLGVDNTQFLEQIEEAKAKVDELQKKLDPLNRQKLANAGAVAVVGIQSLLGTRDQPLDLTRPVAAPNLTQAQQAERANEGMASSVKSVSAEIEKYRKKLDEENASLQYQISLIKAGVFAEEAATRARLKASGATKAQTDAYIENQRILAQNTAYQSDPKNFVGPVRNENFIAQSARTDDAAELLAMTKQAADANNQLFSSEQTLFEISQRRLLTEASLLEAQDKGAEAALLRNQAQEQGIQNQLADLASVKSFLNADSFSSSAAQIRDALGSVGDPLIGLIDGFSTLEEISRRTAEEMVKAAKTGANVQEVQNKGLQATIGTYGSMAAAASGFFKNGSTGYKTLQGASKAFYAADLALQVLSTARKLGLIGAVTAAKVTGDATQAASGQALSLKEIASDVASTGVKAVKAVVNALASVPFPYNLAAGAATAAAIAALGVAIGGSGGGGSGAAVADANSGLNVGKGTSLGDADKASESIKLGIEHLSDYANDGLKYSQQMLAQLKDINSGINSVGRLLVQSNLGVGGNTPFNLSGSRDTRLLSGAGGSVFDFFVPKGNTLGAFGAGNQLTDALRASATRGLSSLLGRVSTRQVASGLSLNANQELSDILTGDLQASYFAVLEITTRRLHGAVRSTRTRVIYGEISDELGSQLEKVISGLYDSVLLGVQSLGGDLQSARAELEQMVLGIGNIDLQGLSSSEVQERLQAVFSALGDRMAAAAASAIPNIDLADFQQVGEGLLQTLARVAGGFEYAQAVVDSMNITLVELDNSFAGAEDVAAELVRASIVLSETQGDVTSGLGELVQYFDGTASEIADFARQLFGLRSTLSEVSLNSDALTQTLINAAGGLDGLQNSLSTYQSEFFTDSERAAGMTSTLSKEFEKLGLVLPNSKSAFRALIEGIDTSTESGQQLLGRLLALSGGFIELQDALDGANESQRRLQETLDSAVASQQLPEQNLSDLLGKFNSTLEAALSAAGPELETQADALNALIKPLIDQIKTVYGSGETAQDLIQRVLQGGESVIERLGGISAAGITTPDQSIQGLGQAIGDGRWADVESMLMQSASQTTPTFAPTQPSTGSAQDSGDTRGVIAELKESNEHLAAIVRVQVAANKRLIELNEQLLEKLEGLESTARLEASA